MPWNKLAGEPVSLKSPEEPKSLLAGLQHFPQFFSLMCMLMSEIKAGAENQDEGAALCGTSVTPTLSGPVLSSFRRGGISEKNRVTGVTAMLSLGCCARRNLRKEQGYRCYCNAVPSLLRQEESQKRTGLPVLLQWPILSLACCARRNLRKEQGYQCYCNDQYCP